LQQIAYVVDLLKANTVYWNFEETYQLIFLIKENVECYNLLHNDPFILEYIS